LLTKDLGGVQKLGDVVIKGSAGLDEGLQIISVGIGTAWEVLNRERIAVVYSVLERRPTDGID